MDNNQRQAAFNYARMNYTAAEVQLDADVVSDQGFDEVSDGVWVHAWIKVPSEYIPGYAMTPPAPAATVSVTSVTTGMWPFPTVSGMRHPHLNTDNAG